MRLFAQHSARRILHGCPIDSTRRARVSTPHGQKGNGIYFRFETSTFSVPQKFRGSILNKVSRRLPGLVRSGSCAENRVSIGRRIAENAARLPGPRGTAKSATLTPRKLFTPLRGEMPCGKTVRLDETSNPSERLPVYETRLGAGGRKPKKCRFLQLWSSLENFAVGVGSPIFRQ